MTFADIPALAADRILDRGWVHGDWPGPHDGECLHDAVRMCAPQKGDGYVVSEPGENADDGIAAATAGGAWHLWHLERSREVAATLRRLRRAVPGMSDDAWLKGAARKTRSSTGPGGKSGALGQFRGHLFERLDVEMYNLRRAGTGRSLRLRSHAHAPGYDADRFINGRYAGSVQHKLGPRNVVAAATKAERLKTGSATRATVRVPKDRAAEATRNTAGKIRVQASDMTTFAVERRGDAGLKQIASLGEAAVSGVHQAGRAAGWAAVVSVAIGSLRDVKLLRRGELTGASFAAAHAVDAAEAGVCAAATVGAGAAIGSAMCALAAGTGTVAVGAGLVASSTVVVPIATGVVVGVVIGRTSRPIRRRIAEWGKASAGSEASEADIIQFDDAAVSATWSWIAGPSWRERWAASTRAWQSMGRYEPGLGVDSPDRTPHLTWYNSRTPSSTTRPNGFPSTRWCCTAAGGRTAVGRVRRNSWSPITESPP